MDCVCCRKVCANSKERRVLRSDENVLRLFSELVPSGVNFESRTQYLCKLCFKSLDKIVGMERKIKDLHKSCEYMKRELANKLEETYCSSVASKPSTPIMKLKGAHTSVLKGTPTKRIKGACRSLQFSKCASRSPGVVCWVYDKVRHYPLRGSGKRLGKTLARGKRTSLLRRLLQNDSAKKQAAIILGQMAHEEVKLLCSDKFDSILRENSQPAMELFSWTTIQLELEKYSCVLVKFLENAFPKVNRKILLMTTAMLLKGRNRKMCHVQAMISLLLYAGHAGKQVYHRLQKLMLCLSPSGTSQLVNDLGVVFDMKVQEWSDSLLERLNIEQPSAHVNTVVVKDELQEDEEEDQELLSLNEMDNFMVDVDDVVFDEPLDVNAEQLSPDEEEEADKSVLASPPAPIPSPLSTNPSISSYLCDSEGENERGEEENKDMDVIPEPSTVQSGHVFPSATEHLSTEPPTPEHLSAEPPAPEHRFTEPPAPDRLFTQSSAPEHEEKPTIAWNGYKIVGDNLDKRVVPRHQTMERKVQDCHAFQVVAIKDRVNFASMSESRTVPSITEEHLKSILPTENDVNVLLENLDVITARILTALVPGFEGLSHFVPSHILHKHYAAMSSKSETVPLGILMKDENKLDEMVDILEELVKRYVPCKREVRDVVVEEGSEPDKEVVDHVHALLFGGDQLTVARARSAIRQRQTSETATGRLEGFVPVVEDWHAKVVLLSVIWKRLYKKGTSIEKGTLLQLKNLIGRTNLPSEPKNNVFACEDFIDVVVKGHLIAAAKEMQGFEAAKDEELGLGERCRIFFDNVRKLVRKHVKDMLTPFPDKTVDPAQPKPAQPKPMAVQPEHAEPKPAQPKPMAVQPEPAQPKPMAVQPEPAQPKPMAVQPEPAQPKPMAVQPEPAQPKPMAVQPEPAELEPAAAQPEPVRPKAAQLKPAQPKPARAGSRISKLKPAKFKGAKSKPTRPKRPKRAAAGSKPLNHDGILNYSRQVITLGLLYMEFVDAIREGDGLRVIRCWRFFLLIFKSSNRKNYSIEAFNLLMQYQFTLPPQQAAQLVWSRFVNTQGRCGHNMSCDLYLEHLNHACKTAISALGANKTKKSMDRTGKCVGSLLKVLQQFDTETDVKPVSQTHSKAGAEKDIEKIVQQLLDSKVFHEPSNSPKRFHPSFVHLPSSAFMNLDKTKVLKWMKDINAKR